MRAMRNARPATFFALATILVAAACGLDFDRYDPSGIDASTDGSLGDGSHPEAGMDAPLHETGAGEASPEAAGDDATGDDAGGMDAPVETSTYDGGACGGPGQACCPSGTACQGGGCCSGGTCAARGQSPTTNTVCLDGTLVACGGQAGPCCESATCGGKRCCVDGVCIAEAQSCGGTPALGMCFNSACGLCGGDGQNCCTGAPGGQGDGANFCTVSGDACNSTTNKCAACGGSGQPCCDGVWCGAGGCCDQTVKTCIASTAICGGGQGKCVSGACQGGTCGGVGEACCGGGVECTAPFSACQANVCVGCGGTGEPCCPGNNTGGEWCSGGEVCVSGGCAACGASGQSCCAGAECKAGICAAGKCP